MDRNGRGAPPELNPHMRAMLPDDRAALLAYPSQDLATGHAASLRPIGIKCLQQ